MMWQFVSKLSFTLFSTWPYNCVTFASYFSIYLSISTFSPWNNWVWKLLINLSISDSNTCQDLTHTRHSKNFYLYKKFFCWFLPVSTRKRDYLKLFFTGSKSYYHSWVPLGWVLLVKKKNFFFPKTNVLFCELTRVWQNGLLFNFLKYSVFWIYINFSCFKDSFR